MNISISYKDTLFKRSNLTPICGKPTFKMIHKLQDDIKANTKAVYSDLGRGSNVHIGLVLTDAQCALISLTPFVYPTHPGLIIIPYGTTAHKNYNTLIAHTKAVRLFREVMGAEQALVQKITSMDKEAYLMDILNRKTSSINNTVADVLNHLQDNYGQLMPHEFLELE